MLLQMELVLVFTPTSEILFKLKVYNFDKIILLFRWVARPWYKPERTGLGYYKDKFLVFLGWHSEMPGPQWIPTLLLILHRIYFLIAWEALDIVLKNWSGFVFHEYNFFLTNRLLTRVLWSSKMVRLNFYNLIFINFFVQLDMKKWCNKLRGFKGAQCPGTGTFIWFYHLFNFGWFSYKVSLGRITARRVGEMFKPISNRWATCRESSPATNWYIFTCLLMLFL